MLKLKDIYNIIYAMDKAVLDIEAKTTENPRPHFHLQIDVTPEELEDLNTELYIQTKGTLEGIEKVDEIIANIMGFECIIKVPEETNKQQVYKS